MKQYAALESTLYFWFAANTTSGSGGDGASPAADVRLAGAAVDAIPTLSPTPTLLTHANYSAGCYEVAVAATTGNGFAADNTYAVFCTLAIDSQNPTGFIGSFDLKPVIADAIKISGDTTAADNLESDYDGTGYTKANSAVGTCTANTDMRGTDSANTTTPPTVTEIRTEMDTNSVKMAPSQTLNDYKATGFSTHSAADVLTATVEGTLELKQAMQVIMAFAATKVSGGGTTSIVFRDHADTKNRVTMTVDTDGNRSAVTYSFD